MYILSQDGAEIHVRHSDEGWLPNGVLEGEKRDC